MPRFTSRYGPGQPPPPRRPARTRPRDRAIDQSRTLDACAGAALLGCFEFVGSEVSTRARGGRRLFFPAASPLTLRCKVQLARPIIPHWAVSQALAKFLAVPRRVHAIQRTREPPRATARRPPHPWGKNCGPKRRRPLRENKQNSPLRRLVWSTPGKAHRLPGAPEGNAQVRATPWSPTLRPPCRGARSVGGAIGRRA